MSTAVVMLCAYCGRPMLSSVLINGNAYHLECTRGPDFTAPRQAPPLDAFDEAAIRRIVREELARSTQTAPGGPAGVLRPDEQSRSGPSDRALNPQPEAVDHDRGAR